MLDAGDTMREMGGLPHVQEDAGARADRVGHLNFDGGAAKLIRAEGDWEILSGKLPLTAPPPR